MKINLSFNTNVDLVSKLELTEPLIENIFCDIFNYVIENDYVKIASKYSNLSSLDFEELEADLYICDDVEIRKLNKQYRGIDLETDVLSFALHESPVDLGIHILHLGEIIISADRLVEQAKQNAHSNLHELAFLISHGLLHLLGLHHEVEESYESIINIQNKVMKEILPNYQ